MGVAKAPCDALEGKGVKELATMDSRAEVRERDTGTGTGEWTAGGGHGAGGSQHHGLHPPDEGPGGAFSERVATSSPLRGKIPNGQGTACGEMTLGGSARRGPKVSREVGPGTVRGGRGRWKTEVGSTDAPGQARGGSPGS